MRTPIFARTTRVRQVVNADGQKQWDGERPLLQPDPETLIPMREMLAALSVSGAGHNILLADCCREDPNRPRGFSSRSFGSQLLLEDIPENTAVLFACSKGEQAFESDDWQHGAFTKALLDVCASSDQTTANELSVSLFRGVKKLVQPTGHSQNVNSLLRGGVIELGIIDPERRRSAMRNTASLSTAVTPSVQQLADSLQERQIGKIALGDFVDKTTGNFGPGLQRHLELAFLRHGISIAAEAETVLMAEISIVDNDNDLRTPAEARMLSVQITLRLVHGGEVLGTETLFLSRSGEIAQVVGAVVAFDPENPSVRNAHRELRSQIQRLAVVATNPTGLDSANSSTSEAASAGYFLDGPRIKARADSPIAVEIVVGNAVSEKPTLRSRSPMKDSAFPVVPIAKGEMYEVIVYNDSDKELAIGLTIDGLDQFTFSEDRDEATGKPLFTHWIIRPRTRFSIPGWQITTNSQRQDNIKRFLVTKYGDGASQYVPHPDKSKVGVVCVSVSEVFQTDGRSRSANAETGFGPDVELKQEIVERTIEPPHEIISIRYLKE
jgi:hypothetical protein